MIDGVSGLRVSGLKLKVQESSVSLGEKKPETFDMQP